MISWNKVRLAFPFSPMRSFQFSVLALCIFLIPGCRQAHVVVHSERCEGDNSYASSITLAGAIHDFRVPLSWSKNTQKCATTYSVMRADVHSSDNTFLASEAITAKISNETSFVDSVTQAGYYQYFIATRDSGGNLVSNSAAITVEVSQDGSGDFAFPPRHYLQAVQGAYRHEVDGSLDRDPTNFEYWVFSLDSDGNGQYSVSTVRTDLGSSIYPGGLCYYVHSFTVGDLTANRDKLVFDGTPFSYDHYSRGVTLTNSWIHPSGDTYNDSFELESALHWPLTIVPCYFANANIDSYTENTNSTTYHIAVETYSAQGNMLDSVSHICATSYISSFDVDQIVSSNCDEYINDGLYSISVSHTSNGDTADYTRPSVRTYGGLDLLDLPYDSQPSHYFDQYRHWYEEWR